MNKKSLAPAMAAAILVISLACSTISPKVAIATPAPNPDAPVIAISVGIVHACALLKSGSVMCWGNNQQGQLGDVTQESSTTPVTVSGITDAIAVTAGGGHTCVLTKNGGVKCWGDNTHGQVGDGTTNSTLMPVDVVGLIDDIAAISAGDEHTCALTSKSEVYCWGANLYGRLGSGLDGRLVKTPTKVVNLDNDIVINIWAASEHSCALINSGKVKCWGHNTLGEVGDGTDKNVVVTPVNVVGLDNKIITLTTGYSTTCALTDNGEVKCWGWIGNQDYFDTPIDINEFGSNIIFIAAGADHICAVTDSGTVKCIGENGSGQLGDGTTDTSYTVVNVDGVSEVTSIAAHFDTTCALINNGKVKCWGDNQSGQLGDGTTTNSPIPVEVIGLEQEK